MLNSRKPFGVAYFDCPRAAAVFIALLFLCSASPNAPGQSSGGSGVPGAGSFLSTPTPAAGGGTVPIESEMIAYEAVNELAKAIATPFHSYCVEHEMEESAKGDGKRKVAKTELERRTGKAQDKCKIADVTLLGSSSNLAAIAAFRTYDMLATQLQQQYEGAAKSISEDRLANSQAVAAAGVADFAATASSIVSTLNTLKTQTTQTGSSFAPVEQVLYSDLERSYASLGKRLLIMPYPGKYIEGITAASHDFAKVENARRKAISDLKAAPNDNTALKDLEIAWMTFQGILGGTSGPIILQGAALDALIGRGPYDVLTVQTAAVGGNERANVYFLLNVFYPAPHHLYDGGAVVTYTVRDNLGNYEDGGTLRMMYGLTKWHPPSLHKKDRGFTNISDWNATKENAGPLHWWRY